MRRVGAILLLAVACGPHPARFADRGPVKEAHDDQPIGLPRRRAFIEDLYQADVYVRRELVNGFDPRRNPDALDANSHDQVAASSWHRGDAPEMDLLGGYAADGPPVPPFAARDDAPGTDTPDAELVYDGRGLRYELQYDVPGREGMRTTAALAASRLVHALGYRTPEAHLVEFDDGRRAVATRWPPGDGVDLGPTPIVSLREDDPNDRLEHLDRRTLRALFHVTAWLDMHRLRPRNLRDVYLGVAGFGHVEHFLVGLDGALGVDNYLEAVKWAENPDREDSNFFLRVFSLGLSPKPPGLLPTTEFASVGLMTDLLLPDEWDMSPPFEPTDRLVAGDAYWIAKRISLVDAATIDAALAAGKLEAGPAKELRARIRQRQRAVVAHGYEQTTPCDVWRVVRRMKKRGARIEVLDRALLQGIAPVSQRSYRVRYLDDAGDELAADRGVAATGVVTAVPLPDALWETDYAVVEVLALRGGEEMPRPLQVHLRLTPGGRLRLVGVRH
jgi:hypothetical protein